MNLVFISQHFGGREAHIRKIYFLLLMKFNYQTCSMSHNKKYIQLIYHMMSSFTSEWNPGLIAFSQHWLFTKDQKLTNTRKNRLGETYIRSIAYESWLMCSAHLFRFKIITYVKVTRLWCLTNSFHQKNASQWMVFPVTASTVWGLRSVMTWS